MEFGPLKHGDHLPGDLIALLRDRFDLRVERIVGSLVAVQRSGRYSGQGAPAELPERRIDRFVRAGKLRQYNLVSVPCLREFGPAIWMADGPVVSFLGFPYPTRMAVIRLSDGALFVWSPVALSAALRREMEALGPVRYLVSPNRLHHLWLGEWQSAYPQARLYAPPGLRRKRKDLAFDGDLRDTPEREWATDIDQVAVRGSLITEVEFFHRTSGTVLFGDLLQNFPPGWFKGWRGVVARLDGIVAPHPGAPREWRATFLNRRAGRAALRRILSWPIQRLLIAHGDPATTDGAAFVRHAFGWLIGGEPGPPDM